MGRVTATEVKQIIDTDLLDVVVDSYILSANVFLNSIFGASDVSDLMKEIERWTSAHMIAISKERQAKWEEAGGAKVEYYDIGGEGLALTSFGQMALTLDTTGLLKEASSKRIASVYAVKSQ